MKMSNKVYDVLVWIAQIVLPALITFCGVVFSIWGFPHGEQVVATIAAVNVFLGAILKINNVQYKKSIVKSEVE